MKRQFSIYGALAAFTLFWGMLTGCEADDTPGGSSSGEVVPVTISLQMDEVDQLTKAVLSDEQEKAIKTLDVYIYNGSTVEKHLTKDNFGDDLQAETTLSEGQKTIYAIANAGDSYGEIAPANTAVNAFSWLDVQSDAYMPMSTTEDTTWMVSSSQSEYKVRLSRMVAKMNVKIVDERADQTKAVGNITIENLLLAQTPLYRSEYGVVASPGEGNDWNGVGINDGETFYLHENRGTFPISVIVGTDVRTGNLEANIPRNHIFPLVIHLTDYSLNIDVEYQLAAIGTLPVTKKLPVTKNLNTYSFELPEGCTFDVEITPKKGEGNWENASWTVGVPENTNTSIVLNDPWTEAINNTSIVDSYTFSGKVSAIHPGDSYKCTIPISLTDGGKEYNFTIEMSTRPLKDGDSTKSYSVSAETEAVHIDL